MKNLLTLLTLALLFSACGTVRDCDGNRYRTVKINGMHCMAENLRTTHYADGSSIPQGDATTRDTTGIYYFDYGNSRDSVRKYGLLYTWAAAVRRADSASTHVQGVCPDGWHLPDDAEWTSMTQGCTSERYLNRIPVSSQNMRIIKRFVRPPRSGYFYRGAYAKVGEESYWWSSSPTDDGTALGRYIDNFSYPCPYVCFGTVCNGYSVRCVKDGAKITTPKTKLKEQGKGNTQQLSHLDLITDKYQAMLVSASTLKKLPSNIREKVPNLLRDATNKLDRMSFGIDGVSVLKIKNGRIVACKSMTVEDLKDPASFFVPIP